MYQTTDPTIFPLKLTWAHTETLRASKTDVKRTNYGKTHRHIHISNAERSGQRSQLSHTMQWHFDGKCVFKKQLIFFRSSNWFKRFLPALVTRMQLLVRFTSTKWPFHFRADDRQLEWESNLEFQFCCAKPTYLTTNNSNEQSEKRNDLHQLFRGWCTRVCEREKES